MLEKKKIELWIETTSELSKKVLLDNADFIKKSAGISVIKFNKTLIGGFIQRVVGECVIKIPLDGLVDVEKEKTKAEK